MFTLGILTVSTSGHQGKREDASGMAIRRILSSPLYEEERYEVIADVQEVIEDRFRVWADRDGLDLIISTGGTGLSPNDVTPEACLAVIDREVPGMAETMRAQTLSKTPMAMLSRSVAGAQGAHSNSGAARQSQGGGGMLGGDSARAAPCPGDSKG